MNSKYPELYEDLNHGGWNFTFLFEKNDSEYYLATNKRSGFRHAVIEINSIRNSEVGSLYSNGKFEATNSKNSDIVL